MLEEVPAFHPIHPLSPIHPRLTHGSPRVAETEQDRRNPQGVSHLGDQGHVAQPGHAALDG